MTNDALNEKENKLDRLQMLALVGLMLLGTAFVYSATMASPQEGLKLWFAQTWFKQVIWYGLGFGGHGVAPTTAAGELIAKAIGENEPIPKDFERYGLPRTFRPAGLLAAQATYSWFQLKDAWRER